MITWVNFKHGYDLHWNELISYSCVITVSISKIRNWWSCVNITAHFDPASLSMIKCGIHIWVFTVNTYNIIYCDFLLDLLSNQHSFVTEWFLSCILFIFIQSSIFIAFINIKKSLLTFLSLVAISPFLTHQFHCETKFLSQQYDKPNKFLVTTLNYWLKED